MKLIEKVPIFVAQVRNIVKGFFYRWKINVFSCFYGCIPTYCLEFAISSILPSSSSRVSGAADP